MHKSRRRRREKDRHASMIIRQKWVPSWTNGSQVFRLRVNLATRLPHAIVALFQKVVYVLGNCFIDKGRPLHESSSDTKETMENLAKLARPLASSCVRCGLAAAPWRLLVRWGSPRPSHAPGGHGMRRARALQPGRSSVELPYVARSRSGPSNGVTGSLRRSGSGYM